MTNQIWPKGLLTALVTPMTGDDVDPSLLDDLLEFQLAAGVSGLIVAGGTGEYGTLSVEERARLAGDVVVRVHGRVPVIVQTGALSTRDAVGLSRAAAESGADGLLVASPFGEPINWRERYRFYEEVAAATELPIMIYNTPPSGLLNVDQIAELALLPNVSAIKDSSGDPFHFGDLLEAQLPDGLAVYVGSDSNLYDSVAQGATGAVFGSANFIPQLLVPLIRELQNGGPSARTAHDWSLLRPFLRFLEDSDNYIALCKVGLREVGIEVGDVRAPYLTPEEPEETAFAERLGALHRAFRATDWSHPRTTRREGRR
ncbi:dihydrodipicolinate synthase family protein [uncultured Microbacterium sp.]|uniref:dihydrodipicolinate synthase family protein n=1 Tax=uncultured Microbacterium sp. TaxID=191216 RepID=UPI0035CAF5BC